MSLDKELEQLERDLGYSPQPLIQAKGLFSFFSRLSGEKKNMEVKKDKLW